MALYSTLAIDYPPQATQARRDYRIHLDHQRTRSLAVRDAQSQLASSTDSLSFAFVDTRYLPREKHCITHTEWAKQYGPLTFLTAMGRSVLVINSPEVAKDLLDKKGQIYSDRPRSDKGELKGV